MIHREPDSRVAVVFPFGTVPRGMDADFEHEVQVRYRDLDTYGHVNNVVYGTYCEEARAAWAEAVFEFDDIDEFSAVVANLELNLRRSVQGRGTLTVGVSLTNVGDSSFTLSYRVVDGERVMAEGESTMVYIDPDTREPSPLPPSWRERIAEFHDQ